MGKTGSASFPFEVEVDDGDDDQDEDDCCTQIYGTQLTMPAIKSKYNKSYINLKEQRC